MSIDVNDVLSIAYGQIGYKAQIGKINKYAEALDKTDAYNTKKNGYDWCDVFVDWCFYSAYGLETMQQLLYQPKNGCGAGCEFSAKYFKDNNAFYKEPQIGDQIFFDWNNDGKADHTGIVYSIETRSNNQKFVVTVEGNTNATGESYQNGEVCKKTYSYYSSSIYGYGRPNFVSVKLSTQTKTTGYNLSVGTVTNAYMWNYFIAKGYSAYITSAVIGIVQAYSSSVSYAAPSASTLLSISEFDYYKQVDSDSYQNFINDNVAFGLIQTNSRDDKNWLLTKCRESSASIADIDIQLDLISYLLQTKFISDDLRDLSSAKNVSDACRLIIPFFEARNNNIDVLQSTNMYTVIDSYATTAYNEFSGQYTDPDGDFGNKITSAILNGTNKEIIAKYGSYAACKRFLKRQHGGPATNDAEATEIDLPQKMEDVIEAVNNHQTNRLISTPTLVESPFVTVKIGNITLGTFSKSYIGNSISVTYPNFMKSIAVVKINGTVNQYTITFEYQIQPGQDPNLLDKIFSSVGFGTIYISYGDYSAPSYIYREEEAIITNLKSRIDFGSSKITYTMSCTSNALALVANSYSFNTIKAKPSDVIISTLFNPLYGLDAVFTGMKTKDIARSLIASDDKEVELTQMQCNPLQYLNYLCSNMIPNDASNGSLTNAMYVLTIHEDYNKIYSGPYFKVSKVTTDTHYTSVNNSDVYEVDVGYNSATRENIDNLVMSFSIDDDNSWSLLYNYSDHVSLDNYTYNIDNNGKVITSLSKNMTTSINQNKTTAYQTNWWTQMTQFPVKATLVIKGLLRPSMLMSYVKINSMFYGQRHVSSGLYVITKQEDRIDESGYRTTLSLLRVSEYTV